MIVSIRTKLRRKLKSALFLSLSVHLYSVQDCEEHFYQSEDSPSEVCKKCPAGKKCGGGKSLPYPKEGYWSPLEKISIPAMDCSKYGKRGDNCPGGDSRDGNEEYAACFENSDALARCVSTDVSSHASLLCAEGSRGRLCDVRSYKKYIFSILYVISSLFSCKLPSSLHENINVFFLSFKNSVHIVLPNFLLRQIKICEEDFFYATNRGCIPCEGSGSITGSVITLLVLLGVGVLLALLIAGGRFTGALLCCFDHRTGVSMRITDTSVWKIVTDVPRAKILWATAQIVSTISQTANVGL